MTPLVLGEIVVDPPVVLAPMAGVTNVPFRAVCRRFGGGLFVSEMVGARALVEAARRGGLEADRFDDLSDGRARTILRASFAPGESPRSLQLYGVDVADLREAVTVLAERDLVDHVDLNFGCPAGKVTRHGGGAALPWRIGLFERLVAAAVDAAGGRPVTVKLRMGIDAEHLTYLDAGRVARDVGAAAVTLHGRTAHDAYGGTADWDAIAALVQAIGDDVPVLGNGDIWQAGDAVAMMARTGCAGVVVGRGCLGRPWLFRDLEAALAGREVPAPPLLGEVAATMADHARLLGEHLGEEVGMRDFRKHTGWYLQGFEIGRDVRLALRAIATLDQLDGLLQMLDCDARMPESALAMQRGHTHGPRPVRLPHGWLATREHADDPLPQEASLAVSGG